MLDLFLQYMKRGEAKRALLVGQNMVNRNPADKKCFEAYFDYLLSLAQNKEISMAKSFLEQANGALVFFSENIEMDELSVEFIIQKERELNQAIESLNQRQKDASKEAVRQEVIANNDTLEFLEQMLEKIRKCERPADFHTYMSELGRMDKRINRARLSERQERKYDELTQKSADIVNSKMAYFEKIRNREYNMQAVEAYEKIFNMFKNGNWIDDHKEALKALFTFDASRLYNETLVYYNHVYNYILSQLNDEEKFAMTKLAILSEKKR